MSPSSLRAIAAGAAVLVSSSAWSQAAPPDGPDPLAGQPELSPDAFVREVLARNLSVTAARAAADAAAARVGMEGALMNPMLEWELAPLSLFGDEHTHLGTSVQLSQRLPLPGKRGLKREAAEAEATAAKDDIDEVRLELRAQALGLYADWYANARARELNRATRTLLFEMKRAAEAQYAAGIAPQQDALQAELMLAELEQEGAELESAGRVLAARINGLLHRDPTLPVPPPPAELNAREGLEEAEALEREALESRPELRAMTSRIRGAEATATFASRAWWPDLEVMTSYSTMWPDPPHRFMVGVGFEIPLQLGALRSDREMAEAMASRMRAERLHMATTLRAEVREAREMVVEAVRVAELQEKRVLPAARANLEAARTGYVTGRVMFQAVIEAERALRNAQLKRHLALASVIKRRAELERMVGLGLAEVAQ